MIIWIDGTYGVGKTAVSMKIRELSADCEIEVLESDVYAEQTFKKVMEKAKKQNCLPAIGGTLPQNNIEFLEEFKNLIEQKVQSENKKILVDMSLTMKECKENLFDALICEGMEVLHIILVADENTIRT